jgi:hypothetical protein
MYAKQNHLAPASNLETNTVQVKVATEIRKVLIGAACVSVFPMMYVVGRLLTVGTL